MLIRIVIITIGFLCGNSKPSNGGIFRHDVSIQKYTELANQAQFDCVGIARDNRNSKVIGSCVLIGERFVLSAAHCFLEAEQTAADTIESGGKRIITFSGQSKKITDVSELVFSFNRKKYQGKRASIFPGYLNPSAKRFGDLILIELDRPVKGVKPATLYLGDDELHAEVIGVGYGASGPANDPYNIDSWLDKIAGQNVIDSISGEEYQGQPTVLMCDFDRTEDSVNCNKMGSGIALPLEYISTGGDSGGGLFVHADGGWKLVGILTGGGTDLEQLIKTGYYGQVMKWTRVSAFQSWIKESIQEFIKGNE